MNINLYKNWYLKTDQLNYTLYQKETIKDSETNSGEEYEKVEGYYTTIEGALKGMCDKEIRMSKCTTLNGLVTEIKKLRSVIEGLCKEIGANYIVENVCRMQEVEFPNLEAKEVKEKKAEKKKPKNKTK